MVEFLLQLIFNQSSTDLNSGKEPACQCRRCKRHWFDPWVGKSPWKREMATHPGLPTCLESPMDRGAWWATVHGVAKSRTRLRDFTFTLHFHALEKEMKSESEVAQLCLTLHDPMDCSPPGSSVHGIFQARVLKWGAIAFSVSH